MAQRNAKNGKMVQLTVWDCKGSRVEVVNKDFNPRGGGCNFCNSRFVAISYIKWLKLEQKRIAADPKRMAEIRNKGDKVALFVNPVKSRGLLLN